jgi:hypothetical protein
MARFFLSTCGSLVRLKDSVPSQGFQKLPDIRSHRVDIRAVRRAYLFGYLVLVTSGTNQFEDLRSDGIEAEHLALLDF